METSHAIEQLIQTVITKSAGEDIAVHLWQPLAFQLVSIIGENGFNSLYNRSFYLTRLAYPWLADIQDTPQYQFTDFRACLEGQSIDEANDANCMLLVTFTNILVTLIGEPLTITILNSAWGDTTPDIAGEELQHE